MSDVIHDAYECARAIECALEQMDPPIEVFIGILKLIAEFSLGYDEWRYLDNKCIKVNDRTVTRTSKDDRDYRSAYGTEVISSGKHAWRIRIQYGCEHSNGTFIGVSRNYDRTDTWFHGDNSGYAYNPV